MRRLALVASLSLLVTSCGLIDAFGGDDGYVDGVGRIPGGDVGSLITVPEGVEIDFPELDGKPLGSMVEGPRLLMIGDSIFASTSSRYGNEMCKALTQLGWQMAMEAEAGRFVDFGQKVLRSRFDAGWDAVVVFLGTNYDGNEENYETRLREIIETVWPTKMVLLTTAMFRDTQAEVNEVIKKMRQEYDNITVLDWGAIAASPGVIGGDRVHLTQDGRSVLAAAVARALNFAPGREEGKCLDSQFRDDSEVAKNEMVPVEPVSTSASATTDVDASTSTSSTSSTSTTTTTTTTSTTTSTTTTTTIPSSTTTRLGTTTTTTTTTSSSTTASTDSSTTTSTTVRATTTTTTTTTTQP